MGPLNTLRELHVNGVEAPVSGLYRHLVFANRLKWAEIKVEMLSSHQGDVNANHTDMSGVDTAPIFIPRCANCVRRR
jgi:hypothetical protein